MYHLLLQTLVPDGLHQIDSADETKVQADRSGTVHYKDTAVWVVLKAHERLHLHRKKEIVRFVYVFRASRRGDILERHT